MSEVIRLSDLNVLIEPQLPGVHDHQALLQQTIRGKVREFCRRTAAWRSQLESVDLVADQVAYVMPVSFEASVLAVVEVRINTAAGVTAGTDGCLIDPSYYTFAPSSQTLTLDAALTPGEAVTDGLDVLVTLLPNVHGEDIEDWFFNRYAEGLAAGVIFEMAEDPSREWFNAAKSRRAEFAWLNAISGAKRDVATGFRGGASRCSA